MRLSVIIPTWQEREVIQRAVRAAREIGDEVIVVDAGSPDGTGHLARAAGADLVHAGKGRGAQLHAGAVAARGDALLFLHADAWLPPRARAAIERALIDERLDGGNFRVRFVPESAAARLFSLANDLRRRVLRIYYGDSALFVSRTAYRRVGGFRPLKVMEDYEFVRRLERLGRTTYIRHIDVQVDARRFEAHPVHTLWRWALIQGLYSAGVSPDYLARLYRDAR
jgi:rSAM/selenodomain-associated transferase 2